MTEQKTDKELLEIWKKNEKQTVSGLNDYRDLTLAEKSRIFDLIVDGKHLQK